MSTHHSKKTSTGRERKRMELQLQKYQSRLNEIDQVISGKLQYWKLQWYQTIPVDRQIIDTYIYPYNYSGPELVRTDILQEIDRLETQLSKM